MAPGRLGSFEEAVLLAVARLVDDAYGVTVRRDIAERLGRDISFGAVYATLERLCAKGYLSSTMGIATPERGGKAKRYYKIEARGEMALKESRQMQSQIWDGLPDGVLA